MTAPLKVGPATPTAGKREAKGYLHVACTDLYTHFLFGDRSIDTWPVQLADELRELIHRANQARERGETSLPRRVKQIGVRGLRAAVRIGLAATEHPGDARPGARKARLLLDAFHQREDDFLHFTTDLRIPPTSNQAERDLRPAKIQENISGRPTDLDRTKDRYLIRGVLSTATKHAVNPLTVLRDAFTGTTWLSPAART